MVVDTFGHDGEAEHGTVGMAGVVKKSPTVFEKVGGTCAEVALVMVGRRRRGGGWRGVSLCVVRCGCSHEDD